MQKEILVLWDFTFKRESHQLKLSYGSRNIQNAIIQNYHYVFGVSVFVLPYFKSLTQMVSDKIHTQIKLALEYLDGIR